MSSVSLPLTTDEHRPSHEELVDERLVLWYFVACSRL